MSEVILFHVLPYEAQFSHMGHAEQRLDVAGITEALFLAEVLHVAHAARYQRAGLERSAEHKKMLRIYPWPGNIRKLKNVMERVVVLSGKEGLELSLSAQIRPPTDHPFADTPSFEEMQRRYIGYILKKTDGKVGKAAELLGMKRTSL